MTFLALLLTLGVVEVRVSAAPCVEVEAAEVQRISAMELAQEAPHPETPRLINVRLECSGENVSITVDDLAASRPLVRRVPLNAVHPAARARTAALAITELVAASWHEPEVVVPPPRVFRLGARGTARVWSTVAQFGGVLTGGFVRPGAFGVLLEVGAEHGVAPSRLGTIELDSLSGSVAACRSFEFGSFELLPSAGLRLGGVWARGVPANSALTEGKMVSGPWLGPLVALGVSYGLTDQVRVVAALEGGYALVRLRALVDGAATSGLDGPWGQLTLGLEVRW